MNDSREKRARVAEAVRGVFSAPATPAAAQEGPRPVGPASWIGKETERMQKGLASLADEYKQKQRDGLVLLHLDPETIATTEFANRHALSLSGDDEEFRSLKASILANGQDTPVRVRPASEGSGVPYELVEGHRRLAAIREINREVDGGFQILARIDAKAVEAKDLVQKMYRENAERQNLSAHETGTMFAQWLEAGLCQTQRDICAFTGLQENTVSQYLAIARLPAEVLAAFPDVRAISKRWNTALTKACKEHPAETLARAKRLAKRDPRPEADAVFRELTAPFQGSRQKEAKDKKSHTVMLNDKVLFKYTVKDGSLTFNRWKVEKTRLGELAAHMSAAFEEWLKSDGNSKP